MNLQRTLQVNDMSILSRPTSKEEKYYQGDHIGVWDNFFSPELCQKFIDFYEYRSKIAFQRNTPDKQDFSVSIGHELEMRELLVDQSMSDEFINEFLNKFWQTCLPMYVEKHPNMSAAVSSLVMSTIKIQKTLPQGGYHVWHCEQATIETGRRMAFIILYLNDITSGGETEFLYQSARVEASQGRLVLAPAAYTHMHRGNPPLDGAKYILTSWIEFEK